MAREAAEAAEAVVELTEQQFAEYCSSPCGKCGRSSQEARYTCIPCIVNSKSEGRVQMSSFENPGYWQAIEGGLRKYHPSGWLPSVGGSQESFPRSGGTCAAHGHRATGVI